LPDRDEAVQDVLCDLLIRLGFDRAVGVPDSGLADVLREIAGTLPVHTAPREDTAVAIGCGLTLAGRHPMLFMKNAGMLTCGDALLSLARDINVGLFFLVGWAGTGHDRLPHHVVTGDRTTAFLDAIGVSWRAFDRQGVDEIIAAATECRECRHHFALLVIPTRHNGHTG
jgi:sulfopyruvate decarboxylase TPP-binding subunit